MAGVNPELLPLLANVEQLASDAYVVRYVTVASLVLALYDGLVLFPLELRHIWLARNSVAKWAYLANRYVSFGGIALLVHGTGALHWGNVSDTYCRAMMGIDLVLGAVSIGVANYLVLLKVWFLWDQRRAVVAVTTLAWILSYLATLAVVGVSVHQLVPHTFSFASYGLNVCGTIKKPPALRGIWVAPIVLEVVVFVFTVLNAAHRPRPSDVSLAKSLYRDGILFFGALFLLRIFNLVATVALPASLQFMGSCLIWGVNQALLHRLILNQSPGRQVPASTISDVPDLADDIDAYDLSNNGLPQPTDRLSFFDQDVFNNPHRPRRQVKWADSVLDKPPRHMFMDTPEQEKSLRTIWKDSWRAVGDALDRAAAHT